MRKRKVVPIDMANLSPLQCMGIPEVARLLGVGCSTIYELINAGQLESIKVADARRVLVVSVQQYIERQRKAG
jgi:excisionase family DNA binding protein